MIRPSILNKPAIPPPAPNQGSVNANPNPTLDKNSQPNAELTTLITTIVGQVLRNEGRQHLQHVLNPNFDLLNATDETINPEYRGQLSGLDKIPDIVRSLREFNGNQGEFSSWKKSVDRVLKIYESEKGTPRYFGILSVIRNKITGNADVALESYNTPLEWKAISRCLTLHYADKRDITTLECQLTSIVQGNSTIQQFYQNVYTHLSLILNKLSSLEMSQESLSLLVQTYRHKALDTFIRGLKGDLPRLLGMKEPEDLPQALHLCLKLENQGYRTQYAYNNQGAVRKPNTHNLPPLPPRKPIASNQPFYPQLAYIPRPQNPFRNSMPPQYQRPQQNYQNYQLSRPPFQVTNKQPPPEPMDVDHTIHSRAVNYINRPHFNKPPIKRPSNFSTQIPLKHQRNFHIETGNQHEQYPQDPYYAEEQEYSQDQYCQQTGTHTLQEYETALNMEENGQSFQYDNPKPGNDTHEHIDIHFLE